jgi:glyoxylase-like metal-dependent hydrolase (beta-lactamase superfamily II)
MKRYAILASLAIAGLSATGAVAQPQAPQARPAGGGLPGVTAIELITGGIYKIFGGGGNTLVIVQQHGVVLVDTKMPGNGQAILDEVRKVTDKPITTIISTHSHPDHIGSTDFLRERFPDVRIIMNTGAEAELKANPRGNQALLPTETFEDRLIIGEGEDRIELHHTGTGHTGGDAFVLVPSARLLFMGDVMAWNMAPFLPAGGAEAIADETGKLVEAMEGRVDIVVEGHGHVNDWAALVRLARFNRALVDAARAAYDRGDPPGAAVAELQRNPEFAPLLDTRIKKGLEYGNTPLARAHMNVNVAYAEFAGEPVGFGLANGAPLPETDKHKGSDPADTAPPTAEALAAAVAR